MKISFLARRRDDTLELECTTPDRLRINGELFNFAPLPEGATVPEGVVPSDWIVGPVERIDGEVCLTIMLPYRIGGRHVDDPDPIIVSEPGPIVLPVLDPVEQIASDEEAEDVDA